ncbi:MAG: rane protein of unknown function [Patescibacteria group bacterium]|nr:rane protein of unknown function [Patescibacteria group bacterium]
MKPTERIEKSIKSYSPGAKLESFIQKSLLVILALMPIHAFLSVWLGHMVGHQAVIQAWKEALLLILTAATIILVWRDPARLQRLRQPWIFWAGGFALLAAVITLINHPPLTTAAFGLKTDLEFLLAGAIAATVASTRFVRQALIAVLAGSAVVIVFGLIQAFVLPPDFLTHFGYGPDTIEPFQHITKGTNTLRFPSTLGGPNQLGTYLILPLCLALVIGLKRRKPWLLALVAGGLIVLLNTHSRSAWAGALAAIVITLIFTVPHRLRRPLVWGLAGIVILAVLALPAALKPNGQLQYYLLHSSVASHDQKTSDTQHAASLRDGTASLLGMPFGHGLGTAGPATFHAGTTNIIEDYYLQVGYETGVLGMIIFMIMLAGLLYSLWRHAPNHPAAIPAAAAVIGISLVSLLLPAWTDSSTSLIVWIIAGAITGLKLKAAHV